MSSAINFKKTVAVRAEFLRCAPEKLTGQSRHRIRYEDENYRPIARVGAITIIHVRKSRRSRVSKEDIVSPLHSELIFTRVE